MKAASTSLIALLTWYSFSQMLTKDLILFRWKPKGAAVDVNNDPVPGPLFSHIPLFMKGTAQQLPVSSKRNGKEQCNVHLLGHTT